MNQRNKILSNLKKLKNTDDYSIGERDEIKRWVGKAK